MGAFDPAPWPGLSPRPTGVREDRKKNRLALKKELEAVLVTRPAMDWAQELNRIGVPAGAVLTVPEILSLPQVADRGFLARFENVPGVERDIDVVTMGIKLNGEAPTVATPPPQLGSHNAEIWSDLGLTEADIEKLSESGAI